MRGLRCLRGFLAAVRFTLRLCADALFLVRRPFADFALGFGFAFAFRRFIGIACPPMRRRM
jgi:hypothetical protein